MMKTSFPFLFVGLLLSASASCQAEQRKSRGDGPPNNKAQSPGQPLPVLKNGAESKPAAQKDQAEVDSDGEKQNPIQRTIESRKATEDQPYPPIQQAIEAMFEKGLEPNEIICRAAAVIRNPDGSSRLGGQRLALGRQVLFYLRSHLPDKMKTDKDTDLHVIVRLNLLLQLAQAYGNVYAPQDGAVAAAPYLDSPDEHMRQAAHWLLNASEAIQSVPVKNVSVREFETIRDYLLSGDEAQKLPNRRPTDLLLAMMYKLDPEAALFTFYKSPPGEMEPVSVPNIVEHSMAIRTYFVGIGLGIPDEAEKARSAAQAAIKAMAQSELWWVRMYACSKWPKSVRCAMRG